MSPQNKQLRKKKKKIEEEKNRPDEIKGASNFDFDSTQQEETIGKKAMKNKGKSKLDSKKKRKRDKSTESKEDLGIMMEEQKTLGKTILKAKKSELGLKKKKKKEKGSEVDSNDVDGVAHEDLDREHKGPAKEKKSKLGLKKKKRREIENDVDYSNEDQIHADEHAVSTAAKKGLDGAYEDRISELPDEILIHILSFVFSAKDVKRTCILSKRWRNIWASVPSLKFHHLRTTDCEGFIGFVDNFLQLRNPSDLDTFNLDMCCEHEFCFEHLKEWVSYAVRSNVKVAYIQSEPILWRNPWDLHRFGLNVEIDDLQLPDCIFICPSLEELSLVYMCVDFRIDLRPPKCIDLGRLKTLYLDGWDIDGKVFKRLISACTCLEDLTLRRCNIRNFHQLSSDTIKRLEMCNWGNPESRYDPSFRSFYMPNEIFSLNNLPCLVSASIKYHYPIDDYDRDYDDDDDDGGALINPKLISGLSNATNLDLFLAKCKCITEAELSELPTFHNLRSLKLGGWSTSDGNYQILVHFLQCSPNLEVLRLEYDEILELLKSGEVEFDCPCLEKVEIRVPRWSNPHVHELVKFLHEHTKKLREISIVYDPISNPTSPSTSEPTNP